MFDIVRVEVDVSGTLRHFIVDVVSRWVNWQSWLHWAVISAISRAIQVCDSSLATLSRSNCNSSIA